MHTQHELNSAKWPILGVVPKVISDPSSASHCGRRTTRVEYIYKQPTWHEAQPLPAVSLLTMAQMLKTVRDMGRAAKVLEPSHKPKVHMSDIVTAANGSNMALGSDEQQVSVLMATRIRADDYPCLRKSIYRRCPHSALAKWWQRKGRGQRQQRKLRPARR